MVKLLVPVADGIPEIRPAEDRVSAGGNDPEVREKETGGCGGEERTRRGCFAFSQYLTSSIAYTIFVNSTADTYSLWNRPGE